MKKAKADSEPGTVLASARAALATTAYMDYLVESAEEETSDPRQPRKRLGHTPGATPTHFRHCDAIHIARTMHALSTGIRNANFVRSVDRQDTPCFGRHRNEGER